MLPNATVKRINLLGSKGVSQGPRGGITIYLSMCLHCCLKHNYWLTMTIFDHEAFSVGTDIQRQIIATIIREATKGYLFSGPATKRGEG